MLTGYASEPLDVRVREALVQELLARFVLTIVVLGSRVGVYVDRSRLLWTVASVELIKDEAHVGAAGLCRAAADACEGVCGVIDRGEAVAVCAGHGGKGEGFAVSVHGCKHGVVRSVGGVDVAGAPQGAEDAHGHLSLSDDAMQDALPILSCVGALTDEKFVSGQVLC